MQPKNETEVVEYSRDKKIADPNSLVLDGDSEMDDARPSIQEETAREEFCWHKDQDRIVVHHQPAIVIHTDPKDGNIVIRQEDFFGSGDQIVYFQAGFADKVAQVILTLAKRAK
jgi:hypothetical protein